MKLSILVVLYNREIKHSETLNSLLRINAQANDTKLVVWNNGPQALTDKDLSPFEALGFECYIEESVDNISLSHIYNGFIASYPSQQYVILDHDSSLSVEYWEGVNSCSENLLLPKVISHGKMCSPSRLPKKSTTYKPKQRFSAITSGMVLHDKLVEKIKERYGDVFDENFAFYGIDTSFMLRMGRLAHCDKIRVIDGFTHSLSKNEDESEAVRMFRAREMAISTALITRHYMTYSSVRRFVKSVIRSLKKQNSYPVKDMFDALFSGKHPKCK